jgi:hypothetical protein
MNRQSVIIGGIALLIVALGVSSILISTRKNRVELTGEILKVRTHQMDPEHTIALIDLRVNNPSTQQFVVRELEVFVEEPDGKSAPADLFAESDIRRVLDYYPMLGEKFTPGLLRRDRINPGETTDRSFAVSAPMTDERLAGRKGFRLVVHDVDGAVTEIMEKR